jgi:hypothetical protein
MYDVLLALLSVFRVPSIHSILSSSHLGRSCIPLHAYVQVCLITFPGGHWLIVCLALSIKGLRRIRRYPRSKVGYYDSTTAITLCCFCFAHATSSSSSQFISSHSLLHQTHPHDSVASPLLSIPSDTLTSRLHPRNPTFVPLPPCLHHLPHLRIQELDQRDSNGQCS